MYSFIKIAEILRVLPLTDILDMLKPIFRKTASLSWLLALS